MVEARAASKNAMICIDCGYIYDGSQGPFEKLPCTWSQSCLFCDIIIIIPCKNLSLFVCHRIGLSWVEHRIIKCKVFQNVLLGLEVRVPCFFQPALLHLDWILEQVCVIMQLLVLISIWFYYLFRTYLQLVIAVLCAMLLREDLRSMLDLVETTPGAWLHVWRN